MFLGLLGSLDSDHSSGCELSTRQTSNPAAVFHRLGNPMKPEMNLRLDELSKDEVLIERVILEVDKSAVMWDHSLDIHSLEISTPCPHRLTLGSTHIT